MYFGFGFAFGSIPFQELDLYLFCDCPVRFLSLYLCIVALSYMINLIKYYRMLPFMVLCLLNWKSGTRHLKIIPLTFAKVRQYTG